MALSNETTCKTCGRAIFKAHADKDGNCCFCTKVPAATGIFTKGEKEA